MVSQPPCLKRHWAVLEDMASSASLAQVEPDILPQPSKSRWGDGASHLSHLPVLLPDVSSSSFLGKTHCSSTLSSLSALFPVTPSLTEQFSTWLTVCTQPSYTPTPQESQKSIKAFSSLICLLHGVSEVRRNFTKLIIKSEYLDVGRHINVESLFVVTPTLKYSIQISFSFATISCLSSLRKLFSTHLPISSI